MADVNAKRAKRYTFINKDAANVLTSEHVPTVNSHTASLTHERHRQKDRKRHDRRIKEFYSKYLQRTYGGAYQPTLSTVEDVLQKFPFEAQSTSRDALSINYIASITTTPNLKHSSELEDGVGIVHSHLRSNLQTLWADGHGRQTITRKASIRHDAHHLAVLQSRSQSLPQPLGTTLDAVVHLPYDLTQHDRSLFRFFLGELQSEELDFNATFPAVRIGVFRIAVSYSLQMRWFLIAAEARLAYRTRQQPAHLFGRKAEIYRLMNTALQEPAQACTDEVIMAVTSAVALEFRYYGPESITMHTKALEDMINRRGGFASFAAQPDVFPMLMFLFWPFHACSKLAVGDHNAVEHLIQSFLQTLRQMQEWHKHHTTLQKAKKIVSQYIQVCERAFGSSQGLLRRYVELGKPRENWVEQQCQFSILFNLNLTLSGFQDDLNGATQFLSALLQDFESAYYRNKAKDVPPPSAEPVMYQVLHAALQVDRDRATMLARGTGTRGRCEYPPWRTWKLTEAFKIRQWMSDSSRQRLSHVLSMWLITTVNGEGGTVSHAAQITDEELHQMREEVVMQWDMEQV